MQNALTDGSAAFILGAGADILIASDFKDGNEILPPSWSRLISELRPFPRLASHGQKNDGAIAQLTGSWPAESASLARWWNGDGEFQKEIRQRFDQRKIIDRLRRAIPEKTSTYELCRLLIRSNLVITPNYSSYLIYALRTFSTKQKVIVLDREDLPSLPFPEAKPNPDTIFVVHLHGRCSSRSFPVLDAWGYNIVQHDDQHYIDFLRTLFTKRSVITIGVSWLDPPLRSAAAFVQRTRPYLSKRHLVFYFPAREQAKIFRGEIRKPNSNGLARLWTNVMRAAYGVDVYLVDRRTQQSAFARLTSGKLARLHSDAVMKSFKQRLYDASADLDKQLPVWREIAEFLDSCGDYESPLQHTLLRCLSGIQRPTSDSIAESTEDLAKRLVSFVETIKTRNASDAEKWCVAARIERHLRHHLYLYRVEQYANTRVMLWRQLWQSLPLSHWHDLPPELRFHFLIGKFELKLRGSLKKYQGGLGALRDRFNRAIRIWNNPPGRLAQHFTNDRSKCERHARTIHSLALELLDLGWESIAAKVFCDQMHFLATVASQMRVLPEDPLASWTVDQANQASRISRASGCFRRQVKADSIAAMWAEDPLDGRIQLLGNIRAAEETQSIEPGLLGGLGAALLVCDLRTRQRAGELIGDVRSLAYDLFDEAGLDRIYIRDALKYWIPFAPAGVQPFLNSLKRELRIKPVRS